jgi:hypothetical protein
MDLAVRARGTVAGYAADAGTEANSGAGLMVHNTRLQPCSSTRFRRLQERAVVDVAAAVADGVPSAWARRRPPLHRWSGVRTRTRWKSAIGKVLIDVVDRE